jgi:transcriptional regulator with XRE-family HTH domain
MDASNLSFHRMLRELREEASQSVEVMAILLNMKEEDYIAIEEGRKYPDNETLKRLCMVAEWNYYDTQRIIINEMTAPSAMNASLASGEGEAAVRALQTAPPEAATTSFAKGNESLGNRLREVRLRTGQTVEIISMLLNISADEYRRLEAAEHPGDDLLRRISIIYDWNYHDLISLLRTEQVKSLQPLRQGLPFSGRSPGQGQLKAMWPEMEHLFAALQEREQQLVLSQLELVRDTMRNMQKAS